MPARKPALPDVLGDSRLFRFSRPRALDVALIAVSTLGGLVVLFGSDWPGGLFVENGPVEILQMSALVAAAALFIRAAFRLDEWAGVTTLALASMSVVFLVRETPRCTSPLYEFGPCISGDYKDAIYVAAGLLVGLCALANPALRPRHFSPASFRRLPAFVLRLWPLFIIAVMIGFGQLADAKGWPRSEETLELTAYLLLALLALRAAQASDTLDPPSHEMRPARQTESGR